MHVVNEALVDNTSSQSIHKTIWPIILTVAIIVVSSTPFIV